MESFSHKGEWHRDKENAPGSSDESSRNKTVRAHEKREQCSCHQAIEAAEHVCVEIDVAEGQRETQHGRGTHHRDSKTADLSAGTVAHHPRPYQVKLFFDRERPCYGERSCCIG